MDCQFDKLFDPHLSTKFVRQKGIVIRNSKRFDLN